MSKALPRAHCKGSWHTEAVLEGGQSHTGLEFLLVNDSFHPSHLHWLQAYMHEGEIILSLCRADV